MVVLVVTGAVRALSELSAVSQLWTTSYGRAILVKTGIFAVLVGAATVSRSRVSASLDRLRTAVTVELVLAFGIVVAVSILTALRPGRH